jgi:hypothetical protein
VLPELARAFLFGCLGCFGFFGFFALVGFGFFALAGFVFGASLAGATFFFLAGGASSMSRSGSLRARFGRAMAVLSEAAVERPLSDRQSRSPAHRVLLEAPVSYTCAGAPGAGTQVLRYL